MFPSLLMCIFHFSLIIFTRRARKKYHDGNCEDRNLDGSGVDGSGVVTVNDEETDFPPEK